MNIKDFRQNAATEDNLRQTYDKYKNYSQNQLFEELMSAVGSQKNEGTFDKNKLETILSAIAPNLTEEQKNRLDSLLKIL
ncbi:MAG: hypothetical protein J6C23_04390 [Clostridia bacterium]|nr:hypothetical protein [Clostridia bacterium]